MCYLFCQSDWQFHYLSQHLFRNDPRPRLEFVVSRLCNLMHMSLQLFEDIFTLQARSCTIRGRVSDLCLRLSCTACEEDKNTHSSETVLLFQRGRKFIVETISMCHSRLLPPLLLGTPLWLKAYHCSRYGGGRGG